MTEPRPDYTTPDLLNALVGGWEILSDRHDRAMRALRQAEIELTEYEETGRIAPVSLAATLRMVRAALAGGRR